jgi:hypothetical protein
MLNRLPPLLLAIALNLLLFTVLGPILSIDGLSQIIGVVATGIAGFFWYWLDIWLNNVGASDRKQTVKLETSKTPNQIVRQGCVSALLFLFALAVFACVVWFFLSLSWSA